MLMAPIRAMRLRYLPLLLIYFAYGASGFTSVAETFWVKEQLKLSAEALVSLGVWLTVPWTIKMIFGQMIDSFKIFGSNRKVYVYLGALLIAAGMIIMIGLVSDALWLSEYQKGKVYIFASVISVIGYVIQDVVADTMSTEVVDRSKTDAEIKAELAMIQVLSRLSLGIAVFAVAGLKGWLAHIYSYETMFKLALFIPVLSIIGVTFVRLNPVESSPLNKTIFFGGFLFAVFVVFIGYHEVPYSQEIVVFVSLAVVLYMLHTLVSDLDPKTVRHIQMAMIVIFVYRAMPAVGPGLTWWQIDVLGFDKAFFGTLGQIGAALALVGMWISSKFIVNQSIGKILIFLVIVSTILSLPMLGLYYSLHTMVGIDAHTVALVDTAVASPFDYIAAVLMLTLVAVYAPAGKKGTWFALMASLMNIALSVGGLLSKYLNQIFVLSREIKVDGEVITPANYSELGWLLWVVILIGFIVPIVTIHKFNPDPKTEKNKKQWIKK
ncbi:MAG: PucC family protein [Campylobacterales bacterium]|nr:PucC family protein [Campylobacterales bacterium]